MCCLILVLMQGEETAGGSVPNRLPWKSHSHITARARAAPRPFA